MKSIPGLLQMYPSLPSWSTRSSNTDTRRSALFSTAATSVRKTSATLMRTAIRSSLCARDVRHSYHHWYFKSVGPLKQSGTEYPRFLDKENRWSNLITAQVYTIGLFSSS